MSVVTMNFLIVEPMMFRGPGEFDPFVRGVYSRATTLSMPSPSTVAGALATYCISTLHRSPSSNTDWIQRYRDVLGDDVLIKGPLIKINAELMAEDRLSDGFRGMNSIKEKCVQAWARVRSGSIPIRARKDQRTGIRLMMRDSVPSKNVKEGFLYTAEYVDYLTCVKNGIRTVEIVAEIRGKIAKEIKSNVGSAIPIRLGGEGRVALLSFREGAKILEEIKNMWTQQQAQQQMQHQLALYLATPALFKGGQRVEEYVRYWAVNKWNCKLVSIVGESGVIGAGFMMDIKKRKPIYTSLNAGSIILVKKEGAINFTLLEALYKDTPGEAGELGYGTLIPVPIG